MIYPHNFCILAKKSLLVSTPRVKMRDFSKCWRGNKGRGKALYLWKRKLLDAGYLTLMALSLHGVIWVEEKKMGGGGKGMGGEKGKVKGGGINSITTMIYFIPHVHRVNKLKSNT